MQAALDQARAAAARGEVPIGAVIVIDDEIVAGAGNETRGRHDPTAHAELLAIRAAAAHVGSERLLSADIYVTLEPCAMCAGAISHARLRRLYFAADDPKGGGVHSGARVFSHGTCHHRPDIYTGIGEREAADLLKSFFQDRRSKSRSLKFF